MKDVMFGQAVRAARNNKTLKVSSANRPLLFTITKAHCKNAKQHSENECVVAQALADAQPTALAASVGESITKILFRDGTLLRYQTPLLLKKAIKEFDKSGQWDLPDGHYGLGIPGSGGKLIRELTPKQREEKDKAWAKFHKKLAEKKTIRTGVTKHNERHLSTRQITINRV